GVIAGADRNDAGDQDLDEGAVALRRQLEQRRLGIRTTRLAQPLDSDLHVERPLRCRRILLAAPAWSRLGHARSAVDTGGRDHSDGTTNAPTGRPSCHWMPTRERSSQVTPEKPGSMPNSRDD